MAPPLFAVCGLNYIQREKAPLPDQSDTHRKGPRVRLSEWKTVRLRQQTVGTWLVEIRRQIKVFYTSPNIFTADISRYTVLFVFLLRLPTVKCTLNQHFVPRAAYHMMSADLHVCTYSTRQKFPLRVWSDRSKFSTVCTYGWETRCSTAKCHTGTVLEKFTLLNWARSPLHDPR